MTYDKTIDIAQNALVESDFQLAEKLFQEVLQEQPQNPQALDGLAIVHCQKGETEDGIKLFRRVLEILRNEIQPNTLWIAAVLFHLGLSYRTLGRRQDALDVLNEAAMLVPNEADVHLNLGQLYFELEQYTEAADQFQTLTILQADNASAWLTFGFILSNLERFDDAAEALHTAELLDPDPPQTCLYLAEALRKAERFEESLVPYRRILPIGIDYPQAVVGYGKSLLALGQLEAGWEAMEFRFISSVGSWERHHLTNWTLESDVVNVLAYSEEGIGAELMFASCLPDLINQVEHCVVECEPSLHNLFRRSFPRAEFVSLTEDNVLPERNDWNKSLDAQIALGSLPRHFRRNIDDFPLRKAYLVPDKEQATRWEHRLASLGDTKKIGVLWSGSWTNESAKQRSLPLQELCNLMYRHQDASWINLQHGAHQIDMQTSKGRFGMSPRIFPEAFRYDLDSLASLLTVLDLVITPPGYVAHLAGALGVRTWLLVSEFADWRHTIDVVSQPRCVWHPTVKMYRQQKGQSQKDFFAAIDNDLEKFLTTYRPPEEMPVTLNYMERKNRAALYRAA